MASITQIIKAPLTFITDRYLRKYPSAEAIPNDSGAVITENGKKVAIYKETSGKLLRLSPYCTHIGCVVTWDEENKNWICPCHSSTFSKEGRIQKGPAKKDLTKLTD